MSVEIALPDGCTDPYDSEALSAAISAAGCRPGEVCDGCYDNRFHANYAGPAEEFFGDDSDDYEVPVLPDQFLGCESWPVSGGRNGSRNSRK